MYFNNRGPIVLELVHAQGHTLVVTDPEDPRKQLSVWDMASGMWNIGLGHGVPQQEDLPLCSLRYRHTIQDALIERLCTLFGYAAVVLLLDGSGVIDTALTLAMNRTGRTKVLSLTGAYHGRTGLDACVGRDANRIGMPAALKDLLDGGTIGAWAFAETIDETHMHQELAKIAWSTLAAFIFEPVQGSANGHRLNPVAYAAIAGHCRENGVYIIADEVMTGIGRCGCGHLMVSETYAIKPDMLASAKMLGNGQSIAALLLSEEFAEPQVLKRLHRTGYYTSTTAGYLNPCATALWVINTVSDPIFLAMLAESSARLGTSFQQHFAHCSGVRACRSPGLFFALDIVSPELAKQVHLALLYEGFALEVSGAKLRLVPPLNMPVDITEAAFAATAHCLTELAEATHA